MNHLDRKELAPVGGGRGVDELGRDCTDPRIGWPKPPTHPLPTELQTAGVR